MSRAKPLGWAVSGRFWLFTGQIAVLGLSLAGGVSPAAAQGFETAISPQGRVIPSIGPGVTAMRQDSAGRVYILAKPASVITIYTPDGKPVEQIPNTRSRGVRISYAVDFDISPEGNIVVADRGANAIEIFAPDGSLEARVPVVAPTSVVALSGGQFAVTSLTSKHLVQVLDEQGNYVRSFGDPSEVTDNASQRALADLGRISGDSKGHIFFAFTTVPDPTFREYDRYGYVGYEATIPQEAFATSQAPPADRVQVGVNVGRFTLSDQTSGWISLGSSGDVHFGGGLGAGLATEFNRGGGFRRGAIQSGQAGIIQSGSGLFPGDNGGGPLAGVFSGEISSHGNGFRLGMGSLAGKGGRGRAGAAGGNGSDQSVPSGFSLSFMGQGNGGDNYANDPGFDQNFTPSAKDFSSNHSAQATLFGDGGFGTSGDHQGATSDPFNQAPGIPGAFLLGSTFQNFGVRPPGGGFGGGLSGSAAGLAPGGAGGAAHAGQPGLATGPGAGGAKPFGSGPFHYGGHGGFAAGETAVTATVRVNLGDLGGVPTDKPIITAVAVDPETQDVWAGIGDSLVHFNKSGEPLEMFAITLKGGSRLKPTAILIQKDRFLIATDPWGIYAFARPDGPVITPSMRVTVAPAGGAAPKQ